MKSSAEGTIELKDESGDRRQVKRSPEAIIKSAMIQMRMWIRLITVVFAAILGFNLVYSILKTPEDFTRSLFFTVFGALPIAAMFHNVSAIDNYLKNESFTNLATVLDRLKQLWMVLGILMVITLIIFVASTL